MDLPPLQLRLERANKRTVYVEVSGPPEPVAVVRRRISPHVERETHRSNGSEVLFVPVGRLKAALVDIMPALAAYEFVLLRDAFVDSVLDDVATELSTLDDALTAGLSPLPVPPVIPGFKRPLSARQAQVVAHLLALPHGANFSVPGAGKTAMLLAVNQLLLAAGYVNGLLVICPRSAFRPWEEEVALWIASSRVPKRLTGGEPSVRAALRDEGSSPTHWIFLISYSQLSTCVDAIEDWLAEQPKMHLVLDESHRIKRGVAGVWGRAVHRIAPYARRRDILTGTPLPNATIDLGPQLTWLWPYREIIPDYMLRDPNSERIATERLRPLYQRVTKRELDLPRPRTTVHRLAMGPLQQRIYDVITDQAVRDATGMSLAHRAQFAKMARQSVRLLQVASNPSLLAMDASEFRLPPMAMDDTEELMGLLIEYHQREVPTKFQFVVDRVLRRTKMGLKTIVWSGFVRNLNMLSALLRDFGPITIHGGVPTAMESGEDSEGSREQLVDRFKHDQTCNVLVANPAACGESISLHMTCHHAIYVDRGFNAAHFLQSLERIHRLGLDPETLVTYDILLSEGTIDEVIDRRLRDKTARLARILDDAGLAALALDTDEPDPDSSFDLDDAQAVMDFLIPARP